MAVPGHALAAVCHAEMGMDDAARRSLALVGEVPRTVLWMPVTTLLCLASGRLGDAELASRMYRSLLPYEHAHVLANGIAGFGPVCLSMGIAATAAGLLDDAVGHLEHAVAISAGQGWPVVLAHARVALARTLAIRARGGDHSSARTLATEAASAAAGHDLRAVAADAAAVLARLDRVPLPRTGTGGRPHGPSRRARLRAGITARGRSAVARLTRGDGDEELARRFGSAIAQRALFTAMAHAFQPARALGFEGSLVFELIPSHAGADPAASDWWTLEVRGRSASARRGRSAAPDVTLHVTLADFARLVSGELDPVEALLDRRFDYEGDVLLASRLAEMFGAVEPPDLPEIETPPSSPVTAVDGRNSRPWTC
jgi:hypothetical protein